jgi:dienelactone hydrolase
VIRELTIRIGSTGAIRADLAVPQDPRGVVVFAHGSGSSRTSPRNRAVASELQRSEMATLLCDLLTEDEAATDRRTAELRFDIALLAQRLELAVAAARDVAETRDLPVGLFGASTGAAAALVAAARSSAPIAAVVSRGGRPDLAGDALSSVAAPTLLIVGGRDGQVLALNEAAAARLPVEHRLVVVPAATHLFEEPGALAEVARLAGEWFLGHFPASAV